MAFSALEALQAYGLGQQQALQKRTIERQERELDRKEQTRAEVSQRVGSGDYRGGVQAAIGGGEYDLAGSLSKLDAGQREETLQQAQIMGRVAQQLKSVPVEQRASAYQQMMPMLQGAGLDPDQIAQADLSDQGLDGYAQMGQSIASVLSPPKQGEGFTLAPGAIRYGADGSVVAQSPYDPIVEAGGVIYSRKPSQPAASPPSGGSQFSPEQLEAMAQEAIAAGADPAAVRARMQQMSGGAGQAGPRPFP